MVTGIWKMKFPDRTKEDLAFDHIVHVHLLLPDMPLHSCFTLSEGATKYPLNFLPAKNLLKVTQRTSSFICHMTLGHFLQELTPHIPQTLKPRDLLAVLQTLRFLPLLQRWELIMLRTERGTV